MIQWKIKATDLLILTFEISCPNCFMTATMLQGASSMAHPVVQGFRKEWPSAFAGTMLDKLSGNAIRWSTTQNKRSDRKIPAECFVRGGARLTIVLRDPFLDWWETTLPGERTSPVVFPRRGRRRDRAEATTGEREPVAEEVAEGPPSVLIHLQAAEATRRLPPQPSGNPTLPPRRSRRKLPAASIAPETVA
jgi:hypothetical protein